MTNVVSLMEIRQKKNLQIFEEQENQIELQLPLMDNFFLKSPEYPNIKVFGLFSCLVGDLDTNYQINFVSLVFSFYQNIYQGSFLICGKGFLNLFIHNKRLDMVDIQTLFMVIQKIEDQNLLYLISEKLNELSSL